MELEFGDGENQYKLGFPIFFKKASIPLIQLVYGLNAYQISTTCQLPNFQEFCPSKSFDKQFFGGGEVA